jgi:D-alanyl-lipoteichoic acid biosynthesis protein DltD
MKKITLLYFLPFILSLITVYAVAVTPALSHLFFPPKMYERLLHQELPFIENFKAHRGENDWYEDEFLKSDTSAEKIYLLGSSELAATTEGIPYNFISKHFTTQVMGVGHAGNQCFSIYMQLLAKQQLLKNAPIVIILSPGWFESKPSRGTSSEVFLEFNSERFLNNVLKEDDHSLYYHYACKGVSHLYEEFNSPSLELRLMNFKYRASKSLLHQFIYAPLIYCDEHLLSIRERINPLNLPDDRGFERAPIRPESVYLNWDSIFKANKEEVLKHVTTNTMGIADDYYTEHIHGKTGFMQPVKETVNQELEDCNMLIRLLKEKKANASFIISPLNPYYYKNLEALSPTIKKIEAEISSNGFPYLNLFETDTNRYEKAVLHDVMHLSDYGWYQVNRFIIDTYHLSK